MLNLDPIEILMRIPAIIIGLAFHEFAHAYVSDRLGDPTPRLQGRLTLSPIHHIDIIGLILILVAGFGWAKPVQINPRHYKNPRKDEILVSIAGPLMNLFLAVVFTVIMKLFIVYVPQFNISDKMSQVIFGIIYYGIDINIILFMFNLIPIPPLDGSHVLFNLMPSRHYKVMQFFEQYGFLILMVIIISPIATYILAPIRDTIFRALINIFQISL